MNRSFRLRGRWRAGAVLVAGVLGLGAWTAQAVVVPPSNEPLLGSHFQGGDGNQDNVADLIDWNGLELDGQVERTSDPTDRDDVFAGGTDESHPNTWSFETSNGGANPASANVLDVYRAASHPPQGDVCLYLAFTREASNGTVFATFELNQDPRLWNNSAKDEVPCRTTGDILISFEPQGNDASVRVERWITDHEDPQTECARDGHLDSASGLTPNTDVQASFNGSAITNHLPGGGATLLQDRFGEAAINLSRVLADLDDRCAVFGSTWLHSRASSASESAALKDYVAPQAFHLRTCKLSPDLSSSASGRVNRRARGQHRLRRRAGLRAALEIYDTATLSGGDDPRGTITFNLYGPGDVDCSNAPVFTSISNARGNGAYQSGSFAPTSAGTYRWVVAYSGDDNNNPAGPTQCGEPTETVTIERATPSLSSTASGSVQPSAARSTGRAHRRRAVRRRAAAATQPIYDVARLDDGIAPTGRLIFRLYGPGDEDCLADAIFTSTVDVNGNGSYRSDPFTPTRAGTYRWRVTYFGDANNQPTGPTACGIASETTVVEPARPTIVTVASGVVAIGAPIADSATLIDGAHPTGEITFTVFGPGDAGCRRAPAHTSTVKVSGNGTYKSGEFTPTRPGTYQWVASYSGDESNAKAATASGDPGESSVVAPPPPVQPSLTTTSSAAVPAGLPIHDTAHLSDGDAPTGTISFTVYGPGDDSCAGAPADASSVAVTANGDYDSEDFTPTKAGSYRWVALYSGDGHNQPAGPTACADAAETVVVSKAQPALTTLTRPIGRLGASVGDTAVLSGGSEPTGTITFDLYGPDDQACAGAPAYSVDQAVSGDGVYHSPRFVPQRAGSYRWVATYSGDANNDRVATTCGDDGETVVLLQRRPRLATSASPPAYLGGGRRVRVAGLPIYDAATLSFGFRPTGQITFTLFGPSDPSCAGTPIFTTATNVDGNGIYNSERFTATASGTYRWVASYSGDANNTARGPTACGDAAEQVKVTLPASPALTTSASPAVTLGSSVHDTAHLSDASTPTGTITFRLYASGDDDCSGRPIFTSRVPVAGNGDYVSESFVPTAAGAYRWVAEYSGDARNDGAGPTACGIQPETAIARPADIVPATPAFSTTASASPGVGAPVYDTATLSGGVAPFGSITFALFAPEDPTCAGPPLFTSTIAVTGNGEYRSESFLPPRTGTYRWVATYSGDAMNTAAGPGACDESTETVVVGAGPIAGSSVGPNVPGPPEPRPSRKPQPAHAPPAVTG